MSEILVKLLYGVEIEISDVIRIEETTVWDTSCHPDAISKGARFCPTCGKDLEVLEHDVEIDTRFKDFEDWDFILQELKKDGYSVSVTSYFEGDEAWANGNNLAFYVDRNDRLLVGFPILGPLWVPDYEGKTTDSFVEVNPDQDLTALRELGFGEPRMFFISTTHY